MTMSPSFISLAAFLSFALAFLLYVSARFWRSLSNRGRHFTFGIADFWAAALALVPSMFLIANQCDSPDAGVTSWMFVLIFTLAQFASIYIGRTVYMLDCSRSHTPEQTFNSAVAVCLGGLVFGPLLVGALALAFMLLPASIVYAVCYGFPALSPLGDAALRHN